ncbi:unnamed protein product, partial [Bubo scandiacus]
VMMHRGLHDTLAGWRLSHCGLAALQAGYQNGLWRPAFGSNFEHRNPRVLDRVWKKLQK